MEDNVIKITVTGNQGSGKTSIALAIQKMLCYQYGFDECTITDYEDTPDCMEGVKSILEHNMKILKDRKLKVGVEIVNLRTNIFNDANIVYTDTVKRRY